MPLTGRGYPLVIDRAQEENILMESGTDQEKRLARSNPVPLIASNNGRKENRGGYCIPCAVSRPGFRERAPLACATPFDEAQPRAWIEGRAYSLRHLPTLAVRCVRCGNEAPLIYCPEDIETRAA
jgi:hypothetical protein